MLKKKGESNSNMATMESKWYAYGLKFRGRGPGCQPRNFDAWKDFDDRIELPSGEKVWAVVWYKKELTEEDIYVYELCRLEDLDVEFVLA